MKLRFSHLYLENFMSFREADIDLSSSGFVYVIGENQNINDGASSNGSGKSTIFEAIYWCLTGTTIRGSKDVVNHDFENDGCYVELQFYADDKFVELLRSRNHKKYKTNLMIKVDGRDISAKGIRDSEKVFETTFPELSSDLIGSVIILGQGLPNRFSANTQSGRKQVLEQLTNSDFMIESLKDRLSKREQELKSEIENKNKELSFINGAKTSDSVRLEDLIRKKEASDRSSLQQNFDLKNAEWVSLAHTINETSEMLSNLQEQFQSIGKSVSEKKDSVSGLQNYRFVELQKIEKQYSPQEVEVNSEIASLNSYIKRAESIRDVCPTCGQKLVGVEKIDCTEEKNKLSLVNEKKTKLLSDKKKEINKVSEEYDRRILEETKSLNELKKSYDELDKSIKSLTLKLKTDTTTEKALKAELDGIEAQIKAIDIVDYDTQIEEIKKSISEAESKLLYINNEIVDLNNHSAVITKFQTFVKRDFRGYLLEQYISFLNKTARAYCSSLFGSDRISIKLDGNNVSISYLDKEYESLSGGERQKVDLLVQFSIRDMLGATLNFSSNVLVLDEITDNLDEDGCQKLIDFISSSFKDIESIFLISHRKDLDIPYDTEIRVIKGRDGVSRIA